MRTGFSLLENSIGKPRFSLQPQFNPIEEKLFMKEPDTPQGTIALLALFLLLTLALWGNAYLTMLSRGATQ